MKVLVTSLLAFLLFQTGKTFSQAFVTGRVVDDTLGFSMTIPDNLVGIKTPDGYAIFDPHDESVVFLVADGILGSLMITEDEWIYEDQEARRTSEIMEFPNSIRTLECELAVSAEDTIPAFGIERRLNNGRTFMMAAMCFTGINQSMKEVAVQMMSSLEPRIITLSPNGQKFYDMMSGSRLVRIAVPSSNIKESNWIDLCPNGIFSNVPERIVGYYVDENEKRHPIGESGYSSFNAIYYNKYGFPPPPPPPSFGKTAKLQPVSGKPSTSTKPGSRPEQDPSPSPAKASSTKPVMPGSSKSLNMIEETSDVYMERSREHSGHWFIKETDKGTVKLILLFADGNWKGYNLVMKGNILTLNDEKFKALSSSDSIKPSFDCFSSE